MKQLYRRDFVLPKQTILFNRKGIIEIGWRDIELLVHLYIPNAGLRISLKSNLLMDNIVTNVPY